MSRTPIPFHADDVSSLARALRTQWLGRDTVPGHLEVLNILARAVGCRNFQQLRARAAEAPATASDSSGSGPTVLSEPVEPIDARRVERVRRCFAPDGSLLRWPARREEQVLALWGLWSKLPSKLELTEQQISARLRELHEFGDHALLRRELCEARLVSRTADCREYRRIEQVPPPDAALLIRQI